MDFVKPTSIPPIPTYRVMNSDGSIDDPSRELFDISEEHILTWYRNMLTGKHGRISRAEVVFLLFFNWSET